MQAKDLMTTDVVMVRPETPTREIAQLLLDHTISALPVVNSSGAPVGMVSEGDLIGRDEAERDARRDWWLSLLADGEKVSPEVLASIQKGDETAKDVMAAPVVTVTEDTDVADIARVLATYRVKRVPVVHDGYIVGIVSRADLLRALVQEGAGAGAGTGEGGAAARHARHRPGLIADALDSIDRHFHPERRRPVAAKPSGQAMAHAEENLNASDFRGLVTDYRHDQTRRREKEHEDAANRRKEKVRDLIDHHIGDENWHALLHRAREAAEHGQKEFMLLRFPSQLCSDHGRAINVPDPDWPKTLRGEAAEVYLRWEHELKQHGFHLSARILNFPGGFPGDIGLFLVWGD